MKKKLPALLLAALTLMLPGPRAAAARYPSPQATLVRAWETPYAGEYAFDVRSEVTAQYEAQRRKAYETLKQTMTDEEIAASAQANLLYPAGLLCEAVPAGGNAAPVAFFAADAQTCVLSLTDEILPALADAGAYTNEAFRFALRFCGAVRTEDGYVPVTDESEAFVFDCPESFHIRYVLPEGADNSGNPAFLLTAFSADLTLVSPTKTGWIFDGWEKADGTYTETVPAGTREITLTARFSPRTYRISYVLTTKPGYAFNRVNNTANPAHYVCGKETKLYYVTAPRDYVFAGWYETADCGGREITAIPPDRTGDVILYAKWLTLKEAADAETAAARWGDLDDDGEVGVSDARAALRSAVGLDDLPPEILRRADFALLGKLNVENARILLRVAVGLDDMTEILAAYGRIRKTW